MKAREILVALADNPYQETMSFGFFTEVNGDVDYVDYFFANEPHTKRSAVEVGSYIYTWEAIPKAHRFGDELVPTNVLRSEVEDVSIYLYRIDE